jgi:small subunit ribosomal protein S3
MGQKIHPHGFRVGINKDWDTRWFASRKDFANFLIEDHKIRVFLKKKLFPAGVSHIEIERAANKITINIHTAKPGIVIGRGGAGVEILKADIVKLIGKPCNVNILEIKRPDIDAQLVAEAVAAQLERRISFRRAMKQSITRSMKSGAKGVKLTCGGRLGGAEIARTESYHEGSIPLQTIRADIDFGFAEAHTTYGRIGVKAWIYKGEILGKGLRRAADEPAVERPEQQRRPDRRNDRRPERRDDRPARRPGKDVNA